ncbi:tyrosine-type recombinase/integrase [Desulfotomaculum defluvii]
MIERVEGLYKNLMLQADKTFRHINQGSIKTRYRYKSPVSQLLYICAKDFSLQKITNIKEKHLAAYVKDMQARNLAPSTIQTNISAVKFFLNQAGAKNEMPDNNQQYGIVKRVKVGIDRSWAPEEFNSMLDKACSLNRFDVVDALILAREAGLRIHEVVKLDRSQAEKAARTGELHIKGKGGHERDLTLRKAAIDVLKERSENIYRGDKLFVPTNKKAHQVIKSIEKFIWDHRSEIQSVYRISREDEKYYRQMSVKDYSPVLTFHGVRHSFAREEFEARIAAGKSEKQSRFEVSNLLGHGRDAVTRIYLGGR